MTPTYIEYPKGQLRLISSLLASEASYIYHARYDELSKEGRLQLVQRLYDTRSVEHFVPNNRSFIDVFNDMISHAAGQAGVEKPYFVEKGAK